MKQRRTICLYCGDAIEPKATGRERQFCSNRCKVAYHRERYLRERIKTQQELLYFSLVHAKHWRALDEDTTRDTLLQLAHSYGAGAVLLAMQAIEQELAARAQPPKEKKPRKSRARNEVESTVEVMNEEEPASPPEPDYPLSRGKIDRSLEPTSSLNRGHNFPWSNRTER